MLGAPGVLLLAEPLLAEAEPAVVALPLALFLGPRPAGLYGAVLGTARVAAGRAGDPRPRASPWSARSASAWRCSSSAWSAASICRPPSCVAAHVANLAVVAALPLWAHREMSGGLGRLPVERQVRRRNPMPVLCAAVLPVLAVYVLGWRRTTSGRSGTSSGVLLAVVALNAVRQTMLTREARRLAGELAQMAEERRRLLADMVRALDDDRRRIVSELHAQAVGSLSTLGTVVQTACVSLPASTALAVRESIAQVQGDLSRRAEELRTLLVALRAVSARRRSRRARRPRPRAARLRRRPVRRPAARGPAPRAVDVDPVLELDRRTATIAYRIAQEALLTAVLHARARTVTARVAADEATGGS